jgi:hypothetical protein
MVDPIASGLRIIPLAQIHRAPSAASMLIHFYKTAERYGARPFVVPMLEVET